MHNNTKLFTDRTLLVSGGSRGIGLAIALGAARQGANVVILAKTAEPHPRLPGTVHTAVDLFGGVDIVVNNASPAPPVAGCVADHGRPAAPATGPSVPAVEVWALDQRPAASGAGSVSPEASRARAISGSALSAGIRATTLISAERAGSPRSS
jgi:NAD(P)-dependent dehydrogenase (short-subunit alcohol dehydrogenase family)